MATSFSVPLDSVVAPSAPTRFAFGDFTLDVAAFRLARSGAAVSLQPRVFEALRYLVEHRDRVVLRDELHRELWSGAKVAKNAVWWTVSRLRTALGQSKAAHSPIRTVRKRGYQFVAPVHVAERMRSADEVSDARMRPRALRAAYKQLATRVRAALMADTVPAREHVARLLGISSAALSRHLLREGAAFVTLADEERKRRALLLLVSNELSVAGVASCIGYSNVSNFARAFRRWTGTTPQAFRRDPVGTTNASIA
jgi:DNA-binding winged helix-turn-helix (wHTH) protein